HNNQARAQLVVEAAAAALAVQKTAREHEVKAGSTVHYTIVVRPIGDAASLAVHVCDRLPSDQVFANVDGAAFADGQACWTIPRLARGTSRRYVVAAIVARPSPPHPRNMRPSACAAGAAPPRGGRGGRAPPRPRPKEGGGGGAPPPPAAVAAGAFCASPAGPAPAAPGPVAPSRAWIAHLVAP